jgi:hypothetical protein
VRRRWGSGPTGVGTGVGVVRSRTHTNARVQLITYRGRSHRMRIRRRVRRVVRGTRPPPPTHPLTHTHTHTQIAAANHHITTQLIFHTRIKQHDDGSAPAQRIYLHARRSRLRVSCQYLKMQRVEAGMAMCGGCGDIARASGARWHVANAFLPSSSSFSAFITAQYPRTILRACKT